MTTKTNPGDEEITTPTWPDQPLQGSFRTMRRSLGLAELTR